MGNGAQKRYWRWEWDPHVGYLGFIAPPMRRRRKMMDELKSNVIDF